MKRIIAIAALLILASVAQTRATLFVRELWDNVTNGTQLATGGYPLQGQANGTTTYGFLGIWNVNPADPVATNALTVVTSDVSEPYYAIYPDLPESWTAPGALSLPQPNTNGWDSGTWATRLMASSSWIHLNSNSTNYFAFRWVKRSFYYTVSDTNGYGADDAGLGVGFASGNSASSTFFGIGVTRSVAKYTYTGTGYTNLAGTTDIGDTPYITSGTLGQSGYPSHAGDSGGPYYVQAYAGDGSGYGVVNQCEGYTGNSYPISDNGDTYMWGGIMVGRIVTTSGGNTEIDVKNYSGQDTVAFTVDQTPNPSTGWDAIYHYTSTATLNYLLVWMYGNNNFNPCQIDGIRVASTWSEILGQEVETPTLSPSAPTNTYYQGTPLTFNGIANIDTAPLTGWYQWLYNSNATLGVSAVGIGSNSFTLPSPLVANSGYYSLVFSNGWETGSTLLVTSAPVHVTVVAPSPPIITGQPQPGGRYLSLGAAPFTFNVSVLGTPPFTYNWYQITTGGATNLLATQTTNSSTSSFTLSAPIQASMAGSYYVGVQNYLGLSNSITAAFNVIVPTPGGYVAQVVSNSPWAYWQLNENYGTTNLHDYYGGNDGAILDTTNAVITATSTNIGGVYQDVAAAPYAGFSPNHVGLFIPNNGLLARVNMPGLGNYTPNMTWILWLYAPYPNANPWGEPGFMFNRDLNNDGGYGNAFGLSFFQYVSGGVTYNNELGYRWGGGAENPTQPYYGYYWPSGLYAPSNSWFFVAMVWTAPNSATMYMGTNTGPLTVASAKLPAIFDPNYPGTSYSNSFSLLLGRGGYPWAEGTAYPQNANDGANVYMSDVAIFTNALSSNAIYQIYLAAMNELITTTNSSGNLVLSWPVGTLLSSTNVQGPYSVVVGATSPYTVPKTAPQRFYRVQR